MVNLRPKAFHWLNLNGRTSRMHAWCYGTGFIEAMLCSDKSLFVKTQKCVEISLSFPNDLNSMK